MSINDGQKVDAANSNAAWISKTSNDGTIGKVDLSEASTTALVDTQRVINEIADQSGIANQAATDPNAKVYSSNNVITNGNDQKVVLGELDAQFDSSTGHDHDGVNSKQLSATDLADFNLLFAEYQENTFDSAVGTSIDVSTLFTTKSPGGGSGIEGVITTPPSNQLSLIEKTAGGEIEDGSGRRVYARLTEAAAVWTMSFYVNISGTETAHSLSSQDIKFLYREVFNQADRPTVGANVGAFDTLSAVADIPAASATQDGKVTTAAQSFAGVKEFTSRPTSSAIQLADLSTSETLSNKTLTSAVLSSPDINTPDIDGGTINDVDFDGGTASNTSRITLPSDTKTNLDSLTRKEGTLVYASDENKLYADDGSALNEVGGGGGGGAVTGAFLYDQQTSGTAGGTFSNGAWRTRVLNTEVDGGGIVTLAANQFTLAAGDYIITASATHHIVEANQLRLRNITDSTSDIIGLSNDDNGNAGGINYLVGTITLAGSKTFELQHRSQTSRAGDGFGEANSFGEVEVYATVKIEKI